MKRKTALLILLLIVSLFTSKCSHVHNEKCGYDVKTQTGCTHEHDETCIEYQPYYGGNPDDPRS